MTDIEQRVANALEKIGTEIIESGACTITTDECGLCRALAPAVLRAIRASTMQCFHSGCMSSGDIRASRAAALAALEEK